MTFSRSRDRQPLKAASKVATKKQETWVVGILCCLLHSDAETYSVDIVSSDDDAKSVRSVKSAMSVDDEGPTTPPRKRYAIRSVSVVHEAHRCLSQVV
jgi:hypothetical protein